MLQTIITLPVVSFRFSGIYVNMKIWSINDLKTKTFKDVFSPEYLKFHVKNNIKSQNIVHNFLVNLQFVYNCNKQMCKM